VIRTRDRDRRLLALEKVAAERAKAEGGLEWSLFSPDQLEALLDMIDRVEAGELTEAEADERLHAVPGMPEAFERAYAERDQRRARA
jgi:hypothetical protein